MRTENTKMDDMIRGDEQILWMGDESPEAAFDEALFSPLIPFCIVWLLIGLPFFSPMIISGVLAVFLLPFLLCYLLPVWALLYNLLTAKRFARETHYCITSKGVYIQTGSAGKEETKFVGFDEIKSVSIAQTRRNIKHHVGNVVCEYVTPIVTYSGGQRHDKQFFQFENTPDHKQAVEIINAQKGQCDPKARVAALMDRNIPKELSQQLVPRAPQVSDVRDPDRSFFGDMKRGSSLALQSGTFLSQDDAPGTDLLESLPDETVEELQAELFGADAEEQGAFADPTVNPLPELPEQQDQEQNGKLMQF